MKALVLLLLLPLVAWTAPPQCPRPPQAPPVAGCCCTSPANCTCGANCTCPQCAAKGVRTIKTSGGRAVEFRRGADGVWRPTEAGWYLSDGYWWRYADQPIVQPAPVFHYQPMFGGGGFRGGCAGGG